MSSVERSSSRREQWAVAVCAGVVSVAAFLWFYQHGQILFYGDAVAHISIARRVFDSQQPGFGELGTVWLPLPHLLILPFVISNKLWSSGVGGSFYSMAAYVFAVVGIFRLVRSGMCSCVSAWIAVAVFALNPEVLYMQSTAMTEVLSIAWMVWVAVYFAELWGSLGGHTAEQQEKSTTETQRHRENTGDVSEGGAQSLVRMALCLAGAMLTRYDGWFLAIVVSLCLLWLPLRHRSLFAGETGKKWRRAARTYVLIVACVPAFWMAYNQIYYNNAFEFLNGPYSAKAIEARAAAVGNGAHPGAHQPTVAATFYWTTLKQMFGSKPWPERIPTIALGAALLVLVGLWGLCRYRPWLLLAVPLMFYTIAIAYLNVPIHLPFLWPFGYYNVRYAMAALPFVAVLFALAGEMIGNVGGRKWLRVAVVVGSLAWMGVAYREVWQQEPITLREATANGSWREQDTRLAEVLKTVEPGQQVLMSLAVHSGGMQRVGFPFQRVINETSEKQWQRALEAPAEAAAVVIAWDSDPVSKAVAAHPQELVAVAKIEVAGEAPGVVYKSLKHSH